MSAKEAGAFPSFGVFGEDQEDVGGEGISLSFSTSGSDNGRKAIKRKSPLGTGIGDSSATKGSYKDNLFHQSFGSSEDEKGEKKDEAPAGNKKNQKPPVQEDVSVLSEQRSIATDAISIKRSKYSSARRPSRQQRFAVHSFPSTQDPTSVLENLFISIEQERQMHKLSSLNLKAVNNWMLFLPSITLTLASGVIALITESGLNLSDNTRIYYTISVGVVALVAVFWQALTKILDLGSRAALHESTSSALKRLSEDILLTMSSTEDVPTEYVTMISEKFGQALDGCTSLIPLRIESAFALMRDRMVLMLRPPTGLPRKQFYKKDFMRFYATAYDELTSEIIHHWLWPFRLPRPRVAADNALRNFKAIMTEGKEASRWRSDNRLFLCFGSHTTERSLFDVLPAASFVDEQEFVRTTGTEV